MVKELLIEFIKDEKLNALELIDALNEKEKYEFSKDIISDIEEQIDYKIEESESLVELYKIKQKQKEYNMDTSLVERMIKRKKPLIDEDIETLDTEEIEYYIYDGFDSLTPNQRELLLNKAKISKINISDIEYLIGQIEELKETEKEEEYNETTDYISANNYIEEPKNKVTLGDFIIANSIYSMLNEKEEKKESISNDYEPYQFEEEELEDDDYYFEDPD